MHKVERSLAKHFADKPFVVLGVNGDPSPEIMKKTEQQEGIPWRSFWDGPYGSIAQQFHIQGHPTVYLLDATGKIRFEQGGYAPQIEELLRTKIQKLLEEAGVS